MNASTAKLQVIAPRPKRGGPFLFGESESSLTESLKVLFSKTAKLSSPHRERRATPRIPIELCCEERTGKRPYYRTTYDLSTFGLSTQYGHTYPLGTLLEIRLHLPDDLRNPLDLRAEVVGTRDDEAGMRLAFRQPSSEAVRRIHRYLFSYSMKTVGQA
jgi:hypothetical protein